MSPDLRALWKRPGDPITAADWNARLDCIQRRTELPGVERPNLSNDMAHPWKVRVLRDTRPDYAPAAAGRSWIVTVAPGYANDEPATVVYQRRDDPRGWKPGADTPTGPSAVSFDRTLLDVDLPAPCLLALTPEPRQASATDDLFHLVSDAARPVYFRTTAQWAFDLYQAAVLLTANTPGILPAGSLIPVSERLLQNQAGHRVRLGSPPSYVTTKQGTLEIARLFLLRDPDAGVKADQIIVRQVLFWNVASALSYQTHEDYGGGADALTTFLSGGGLPGSAGPALQVVDDYGVSFWTT